MQNACIFVRNYETPMTSFLRRLLATFAATFAIALPASATSYSIDYSDLWFTQGEDGWGLNVVQQYNTLFTTLYVYGPDSSPRWYFASDMKGSPNSYNGQLYRTTGPVFSVSPFNRANVQVFAVGNMTLSFNSATTGTLTYTVDGAQVIKQITRNTFATNVLTGRFLGGMTAIASSCVNASNNGAALIFGDLNISQSNNAVSMRVDFANGAGLPSTCNFNGTFVPQGRYGTISGGTLSCTQGSTAVNQGSFTMTQIDLGINGMSSVFTGNDQFCQYTGRFGGLRDVI